MNPPIMYRMRVENMLTGEEACFIGQGTTVEEAFKDGRKNAQDAFRPNTSGAKRPQHGLAVKLRDGRLVSRTVAEFESRVPYGAKEAIKDPEPTVDVDV